jgi:Magnesium chelatase, subunit ChlI
MLARRLSTILPEMILAEALETPRIHRVAGLTGDRAPVVTTCLFRAPHHPASDVDRIGAAPWRCRANALSRLMASSPRRAGGVHTAHVRRALVSGSVPLEAPAAAGSDS